ncbi:hypothetical protein MOTT16_06705 [Moraxella osloensis]|uniref:Abortive phage infection protein C-terminal domain-containing protein n=1 Tax=Faucicola osloensis TaxID=34062 RepID=A0AAD0AE42_FAUOS|nr:AIPR family protein [Moraxella osloensis]ATQ83545.1 hypothetical protein YHS_06720 [Moraxella osloensis]ATW86038.1 hypothetical protein MOTT16_06705 [Moraxella osloensis]
MKDEILKSFLENFIEQHGLEQQHEDESFEDFVNFNIISKLYPRDISLDDLSTGGSDDTGLDGMAIIVNGNIITDETEIDFLVKQNGSLNVIFALIQSKSSPKFDGSQVGTFITGVKNFFSPKSFLPENEKIKALRLIKDKIYKESINFDEDSPVLKLFFVSSGEWKEPEQITGKVKLELTELESKSLFKNEIKIDFYDANKLKETYREISRKIVKEIPFNNHVSLPNMPDEYNVRQSYIGSISVVDYLNLIEDQNKNLSKDLFYDNIRDFQGDNKVNKEIRDTIVSAKNQLLLSLMNNGITIIAKKVEKIGSKMKLTDFQIVNGCQTSHILFSNRKELLDDTQIVLKVIETIDLDVTNKIIRATNRQTEVKDEAFESLKPFHKDLQEYYKAKSKEIYKPIYYERRSKEFLNVPNIKSNQIITLASQIKAYVATQLQQPQSTHRYFGELLDSNKNKLFKNKTELSNYYLSALIVNRLDSYFKKPNVIPYKPFKYQIALLVYRSLKNKKSKTFGVNEMINYCSESQKINSDIKNCIDILKQELETTKIDRNHAIRSKDFTNKIISRQNEMYLSKQGEVSK